MSVAPATPQKSYGVKERKTLTEARKSAFVRKVEETYSLDHLHEVSGRLPIRTYLQRLWQRRHFIWWEAKSKVETENISNRLGSFWFILRPTLDAAFYWIVFGFLLQISRGMDNYVAFVIIGVFMFQLTSSSINNGVRLIHSSKSMIRAFQFPRASLVVSSLLHNFLQQIPAIATMFVIIMVIPPHALPQASWILFPIVLMLQFVLNFGLSFIFARLGHALPDLAKAMSFATRLLLYGSGVIFPLVDRLANHPTLLAVVELNPVYQVLDIYRKLIIDGVLPGWEPWLIAGGWAVALFIAGFIWFWRGEETYGREQQ